MVVFTIFTIVRRLESTGYIFALYGRTQPAATGISDSQLEVSKEKWDHQRVNKIDEERTDQGDNDEGQV